MASQNLPNGVTIETIRTDSAPYFTVYVDGGYTPWIVCRQGSRWVAQRGRGPLPAISADTRRDILAAVAKRVRDGRRREESDTADNMEACWRCDGTGSLGDSECHVCRGMGKM